MTSRKKIDITAIILTFDESIHIERVIHSARQIVNDILIVDSYSTDDTVERARRLGARVLQNPWTNHAVQLKWALENGGIQGEWVIRLDADEYLNKDLVEEIQSAIVSANENVGGFEFNCRVLFMGREIRHGGVAPLWLMRIWRNGWAHCEQRWMDEHMVLDRGVVKRLKGSITNDNLKTLTWWVQKHNVYASREAIDLINRKYGLGLIEDPQDGLAPQARTKRWLKTRLYARLPLILRAWLFFFYRMFFRLGVFDGSRGILFHSLQGLWYRMLVDSKVMEVEDYLARENCSPHEAIRSVLGIQLDKTRDSIETSPADGSGHMR